MAKKRPAKKTEKPEDPGDLRDSNGRFLKGRKGGPGNPHLRKVAEYRRAIAEAIDTNQVAEIINRLGDIANGRATRLVPGKDDSEREESPTFQEQIAAAKVWLERVVGKPSDAPVKLDLPDIESAKDLPHVALRVLNAIASGDISAAEGSTLTGAVREYREQVKMRELEERLEAVEGQHG